MAESCIDFPELADIWADDEDHYYLFLTKPSWREDYISVTFMDLKNGQIRFGTFPIDPETSTLYSWYRKVA